MGTRFKERLCAPDALAAETGWAPSSRDMRQRYWPHTLEPVLQTNGTTTP